MAVASHDSWPLSTAKASRWPGNDPPPYAITSPLLRLLLAPSSRLTAADLVLQRAVVRRYTGGGAAGPGHRARHWRLRAGRPLPRRAFRPPPTVDSAVLVVRRR
jgi:23S rRNA (adenine-N6)-dimethyltransferase